MPIKKTSFQAMVRFQSNSSPYGVIHPVLRFRVKKALGTKEAFARAAQRALEHMPSLPLGAENLAGFRVNLTFGTKNSRVVKRFYFFADSRERILDLEDLQKKGASRDEEGNLLDLNERAEREQTTRFVSINHNGRTFMPLGRSDWVLRRTGEVLWPAPKTRQHVHSAITAGPT